jgi:hypothetical protein
VFQEPEKQATSGVTILNDMFFDNIVFNNIVFNNMVLDNLVFDNTVATHMHRSHQAMSDDVEQVRPVYGYNTAYRGGASRVTNEDSTHHLGPARLVPHSSEGPKQ